MLHKYKNAIVALRSLHNACSTLLGASAGRAPYLAAAAVTAVPLRALHAGATSWSSNPAPIDRIVEGQAALDEKEEALRSEVDVELEDETATEWLSPQLSAPGHQRAISQTFQVHGREWTAETGRLARLADGAATLRCGGTTALATVNSAQVFHTRRDATFPALKIDYREKLYAVGRIPGTYNKREGSPKEHEQLAARRIERALRPLMLRGYIHETNITASILSADGRDDPEVLALNAVSAALATSDIPCFGPMGAARVAIMGDGSLVIGPPPDPKSESKSSSGDGNTKSSTPQLTLLVGATKDRVVLFEAEGSGSYEKSSGVGVADEVLVEALRAGVEAVRATLPSLTKLAAEGGRTKRSVALAGADPAAARRMSHLARDAARDILRASDLGCLGRNAALLAAKAKIADAMRTAGCWRAEFSRVPGSGCVTSSDVDHAFSAAMSAELRGLAVQDGLRADGRGPIDLRPITADIDFVPVVHGSSVFEAGETQSLISATVGTKMEQQRMESLLGGDETKRLFVHFSLPEFSAGAAARDPGGTPIGPILRHEMDRSEFIERALGPSLPSEGEFPFTVRINADTLAADGGTGAAAVCGGAVALADAGVPLRSMVAAVGIGMVSEGGTFCGESSSSEIVAAAGPAALGRYELLTDPISMEFSLGDPELRVAGTTTGVTAAQLDVRMPGGVPLEVVEEALQRARLARLRLLADMERAVPSDRSSTAPAFGFVEIPAGMLGKVVGREGSNLRGIEATTQSRVQAGDDGRVSIFSPSVEKLEAAKAAILSAAGGNLTPGQLYKGQVVAIKDFGAFISLPGTELHALLHVSEVALERIRAVEDVLKVGQEIEVEFVGRDPRGGLRVSRKAALRRQAKTASPAEEVQVEEAL